MAEERVVGIDLGTTNSLVAYMEGDRPVVIPGEDGANLVPSIVALDPAGQIVVGNAARKYLIETPERAVYSIKRLMGRGYEDIQDELKLFPFRVAEDLDGRRGHSHSSWRADLHTAGDFGIHSAATEAERGTIFWRAGHEGGHHGSCVLQRCAAPGHKGCGPHRRTRGAATGE